LVMGVDLTVGMAGDLTMASIEADADWIADAGKFRLIC